MLILSLLLQMLMGFKLMHLTHGVCALTCKQLIGDEGEDFFNEGEDGKKEKEKEKLTMSVRHCFNKHVIRDKWSQHVVHKNKLCDFYVKDV